MTVPMTYVNLSNPSGNWKISTIFNLMNGTTRPNMLAFSADGLFTPGENDSEPVERAYSNGSILPPNPRYAGKDFNVDFAIFSRNQPTNVKLIYQNFHNFCLSGTTIFTSDWPHNLTVQCQRLDIIDQNWNGTARMRIRAFYKAQEAY